MQDKQKSVAHGHRWGEWQFDERKNYLDYLPHKYNVPLSNHNLVAQVFDCLRQVAAKTWGTKQVLLDLIQAYSEIFSCSAEFSKPFQSEIAPRIAAWEQFLAEVSALARDEGADRPSWNRRLEESCNRFKVA
jgi:hypothetical protein